MIPDFFQQDHRVCPKNGADKVENMIIVYRNLSGASTKETHESLVLVERAKHLHIQCIMVKFPLIREDKDILSFFFLIPN